MPKLFINFKEILSCVYGNFEEKNKVFEPSIACILMHITIYNKGLIEEWGKKACFYMLELYYFKEKIVKHFIQCHTFMDSSSLKKGPIGSEMSGRKYHYSLRSNPEERIFGGSTVLWNTGSYRPNDTVWHPRILIFSASPLWEPNLSYFIVIFIIWFV